MDFIQWCGFFVVGHPLIDKQHRELFGIINKFHNELSKGDSKHLAVDTLNHLIKFAQQHFSDEETVTEQFGYPADELARHKNIHEQLVLDIFRLHEGITSGAVTDLDSIGNFLTEWIILHILIEDNKYKEFLSGSSK